MPSININVKPGGETTIDAVGFKGVACKEMTAAFERALGTVKTDTDKHELYETLDATGQSNISN